MSIFTLTLLSLVLLVTASILWSTVVVGISPMPSSKKACRAIVQLVDTAGGGTIVDLGSGWGSLVIRLALKYPHRAIVGYELSILPWLISVLAGKLLGLKNLTVYRRDFLAADLSAASVLVCYLHPEGMAALAVKLAERETAVRYLISNNFALPGHQPEHRVQLTDFYGSPIYRYRFNALEMFEAYESGEQFLDQTPIGSKD